MTGFSRVLACAENVRKAIAGCSIAILSFTLILLGACSFTDSSELDSTVAPSESASTETGAEAPATDTPEAAPVDTVNNGEFDITDKDGYSYHVRYSMKRKVSIDTTEGKPGEVAVIIDCSGSTITVTNTTPGKKAPRNFQLYYSPLFVYDENASYFENLALFKEEFDENIFDKYTVYLFDKPITENELDKNPESWSGERYLIDRDNARRNNLRALSIVDGYGNPDDLEVGESITIKIGDVYTDYSKDIIPEQDSDSFASMEVVGWAIFPAAGSGLNGPRSIDTTAIYGAIDGRAFHSDNNGSVVLNYNPVK